VAPEASGTPDAPVEAQTDELKRQLNAAMELAEQYAADLATYRRHTEAELGRARETAQQEALSELGEMVHSLEQALLADGADAGAIRDGVAMVLKGLQGAFERHGLQRIDAVGRPFDPTLHEAVLVEASREHAAGIVVRELSPGFRTAAGRAVRPARVSVAG